MLAFKLESAAPFSLNERALEAEVWNRPEARPRSKPVAKSKPSKKLATTPKPPKRDENDIPRAKSNAAETGKRSSNPKRMPVLGNKNGRNAVVLGSRSKAADPTCTPLQVVKTPSAAACKRSLLAEAAAEKAELEASVAMLSFPSSPALEPITISPVLAEANSPDVADVHPVRTPLSVHPKTPNTQHSTLPKTLRTPLTRSHSAKAAAEKDATTAAAVGPEGPAEAEATAVAAAWWHDEWGRSAPGCEETVCGRGPCESPLDEEGRASAQEPEEDEEEEGEEAKDEAVYESIRARFDESLLCS